MIPPKRVVPVRCFRIQKPHKLRKNQGRSGISERLTHRDKDGIERHPDEIEAPSKIFDTRGSDLDDQIVAEPVGGRGQCGALRTHG